MLRALILGLVQGLTEFLPISSSGHLSIVPELLGYDTPQLAFSVLLHLGTLTAVVAYFSRDLWAFVLCLVAPARLGPEETRHRRRLIGLLALGSVPAAIAGFLVQDWAERQADRPLSAAWFIVGTTSLMIAAELYARRSRRQDAAAATVAAAPRASGAPTATVTGSDPTRPEASAPPGSEAELERLPVGKAFGIGVAQACALIPGVSRSGATISAGLLLGVTRAGAARFTFLLSIPAILGATILKLGDLSQGGETTGELAVGFLAAAVSGFIAVSWLMRLLRTRTLWPFIWYRIIAGTIFIVLLSS